jgi:3-keto-5-aminohexanoate cleavage enzyme
MDPLILNLACTGVIPTKAMNASVPINHQEIVDDVAAAIDLGVQMVHLHARDAQGHQTSDPEPYGRLIESIRALPGGQDLVICITTSGRKSPDFMTRSRVLDLDGKMKPDMASPTLSSLNFVQSASVNEPHTIRQLAARMLERGIKPELEVFDLGMANFARVLSKEGLIQGPAYFNVLLGNVAGGQTDLIQVGALMSALPEQAVVSLAGIGRFQLTANVMGILHADGVRIGLEDNLWMDNERAVPATNAHLVKRLLNIAREIGRPIAKRSQVRRKLGI